MYTKHTLISSWKDKPSTPPSLVVMFFIGNMLMRFVTIADSLWTFISSWPEWNHRGREQEAFCRKPTAPLPPSAGPYFIWIINDCPPLPPTPPRYTDVPRLPKCFCSSTKNGLEPWLLFFTVKHCPGSTDTTPAHWLPWTWRQHTEILLWFKAEICSSKTHTDQIEVFLYFE